MFASIFGVTLKSKRLWVDGPSDEYGKPAGRDRQQQVAWKQQ
jgi:hypothetical protein